MNYSQGPASDAACVLPQNRLSLWELLRYTPKGGGTDWEAVFACLRTDPGHAAIYKNGISPLHFVLSRPASADPPPARIVYELLRANPDAARRVDISDGSTALYQATYNGHDAEAVRLVLRANPDAARVANSFGDLALHVARRKEVARLLLEAYPEGLGRRSNWSSLPLHSASAMMYTEPAVLRLFLEEGKRRGIGGPLGGGGVFLRGPGGKPAHVRLLESIVGLTEVRGSDGALYFLDGVAGRSCWEKLVMITEEIVAACARDVDDELPFELTRGGSILHAMIQLEYPPKVIRLALEAWPQLIYERDELGRTPLAAAATNGEAPQEVIQLLLAAERGHASRAAGMADSEGKLPLHLAIESGRDFEDGIEDLMHAQPRALTTRDAKKGLYPFMLAAEDDRCSMDCLLNLMSAVPHVAVPR